MVIPSLREFILFILALIVLGFGLFIYDTYVPGDSLIKTCIRFVCGIAVIIAVLRMFGFI